MSAKASSPAFWNIAHNVMLGVVIENLIQITLLANKMGVPRHAFLAFINNSSVMGSTFTRYSRRRWSISTRTTTFTPSSWRKDIDLWPCAGARVDAADGATAATCELAQTHFGAATLKSRSG